MRIAILFLTIGNVYFPQIWEKFLNDNTEKYSIYCHPKNPEIVTIEWMKSNIIKNLVPTKWGHLTNAYVELLKAALKDEKNTHFIFVSESCIPIKSFCKLENFVKSYKENTSFLSLQNIYNYDNFNKMLFKSNLKFKTFNKKNFIKHSGWFCLSRYHTNKLVSHPDVYEFNKIKAGDEHLLSLIYSKNDDKFVNFKITYANWDYTKKQIDKINKEMTKLYEYQEQGNGSKEQEIHELRIQKSNIGKHPRTYIKITKKTFNKILKIESFFFRKFAPDSSISKHYKKLFENC
jgi:hypothetical protein